MDAYQEIIEAKRPFHQLDGETEAQFAARRQAGVVFEGCEKMHAVYKTILAHCRSPQILLVRGESGTGKETVPNIVHVQRFNGRSEKLPLVKENVNAIPASLLESALFGHIKGAFTGADTNREGLFGLTKNGGTVFLDEIGDFPRDLQIKMLRIFQEREYWKVGAEVSTAISPLTKIILATHQNLEALIQKKQFRRDLFSRIGNVQVTLPPLRERSNLHRAHLIALFLAKIEAKQSPVAGSGEPPFAITLSSDAREFLLRAQFPDNVRQLEELITSAFYQEWDGASSLEISLAALESFYREAAESTPDEPPRAARSAAWKHTTGLLDMRNQSERQAILDALRRNNWSRTNAAKNLGISRVTLYNKMKKYGMLREDADEPLTVSLKPLPAEVAAQSETAIPVDPNPMITLPHPKQTKASQMRLSDLEQCLDTHQWERHRVAAALKITLEQLVVIMGTYKLLPVDEQRSFEQMHKGTESA